MTIKKGARTANKGEWSEIYAFFKMMDEKAINSSDESLNAIPGKSVDIYKILRSEKKGELVSKKLYDLTTDPQKVRISDEAGTVVKIVNLDSLRSGVKAIFAAIKNGRGAFEIPEANLLMDDFLCTKIKASSANKSDINLVIKDRHAQDSVESGFSIKTAFRATPTLLNPSRHTGFLYEVVSEKETQENVIIKDRVRDRIEAIYDAGNTLKFLNAESSVFEANMRHIDVSFPEIMASLLALYYSNKGSDLETLTPLLSDVPALQKYNLTTDLCVYKVKLFLEAVALGMTPSRSWNGRAEAQGGYIIVKDNGELVCFHMYNRDKFMDYLYKNTKLDTPSTTRYQFGSVTSEKDGRTLLKLNLQIRFK